MKLTIKQIIINAVITLVIAAVMFYIMLPPVTLHSKLFVTYLAIVLVIFACSATVGRCCRESCLLKAVLRWALRKSR